MKKRILTLAIIVGVLALGATAWFLSGHLKDTEQDIEEVEYVFYKAEKEDLAAPADMGVMIMDCDPTSCLTIMGGVPTQTNGKYVQGEGAIEVSSLMNTSPMYVTYQSADISAYAEGSVHVSLYLGYPDYLEHASITLELTSSGECDLGELSWTLPASLLNKGWNELYLGMQDADLTGEPDLTSLNYFRIFTTDTSVGFSAIVDSIYATDTEGMSLVADNSNQATASTKPGYLLDFDTLDGIGSSGSISLSTAQGEFQEGAGGLLIQNAKEVWAYAHLKNIDLTSYKNGELVVPIFINDIACVKQGTIFVEISSSGTFDKKEIHWSLSGNTLKQGWNEIHLSLTEGLPEGGEMDWKNVNFFRIYGLDCSEDLIVILDAVALKEPTKRVPKDGMILSCDTTELLSIFSRNNITITSKAGEYKQGSGAFKGVGAGVEWWTIRMKELVDVSKYEDGGIRLSVYVSDPSALKSNLSIELGSGGTCDVDEYQWDVTGLKEGWNDLKLSFDTASISGNPDLENVNYFRIFAECNKDITVMLDDVRAIGAEEFEPEVVTPIPGVLLSCDDMVNVKNLYGDTAVILTSNKGEFQVGTGAYKSKGAGQVRFEAKLQETVDFTEYKDGALKFWLYVGDKSAITSENITIEITSAGKSDSHESNWIVPLADLKENSWNEIALNFVDANEQEGAIDLANVNYFRIFTDKIESNKNVLLILDHVHAVDTPSVEPEIPVEPEEPEEPEVVIPGMIWDCDNLKKALVYSESVYTFTNETNECKQGEAAYKTTGAGQVRLEAKLATPVDLSAYVNGRVEFDLYIGDKADFTSTVMTVELTSSGGYDVNENNWVIPLADLEENSWNTICLNFAQASEQGGSIDLEAVNYFRLYLEQAETSSDVVMIFDNVHAVETPYVKPVPGMILDCDSTDGLNVFSHNEISITAVTDEYKQGTGAFRGTGTGIEWWTVRMEEAVDISDYENEGIHLSLYVSNANALKSNLVIEVSSGGTCDMDEYQWEVATLTDGWNELALDFTKAAKLGEPDLSQVNYFRMFAECSESITVILDDVRAVEMEETQAETGVILTCDDQTNVEFLYGDNSSLTITNETGTYKEGTGAYQSKGAGQVRFQAKLENAVDLTTYKSGALKFWLYVGDKSHFSAEKIIVELTSSGAPDQNEVNWEIPLADLKGNSWNEMILNFADAGVPEGAMDYAAVNFFRCYLTTGETNENVLLLLDDVRAVNKVQLLKCDTISEVTDLAATVSVTTDALYKKEGTGAYYLKGAQQVRWKMLFANPVDVSSCANGKLHFQLYVDDVSKWNGLLIVELNSHASGADDQNEVQWNVNTSTLQNGWNAISLSFADIEAVAPGNEIDYTNISCMRIFQSDGNATGELITSIDDICVLP